MNFIIPVSSLKRASLLVNDIANTKSAFSNSGVVIKAEKTKVIFYAFNNDSFIAVYIDDAEVIRTGKICVDSSILFSFASTMHESRQLREKYAETDPVVFNCKAKSLNMSTRTKYPTGEIVPHVREFPTSDPDLIPVLSAFNEEKAILIPSLVLKEGLSKALYAVSADVDRPALQGVLFRSDGKKLYIVATSGRELVEYTRDLELPEFNYTVSTTYANKLAKILDASEDSMFYFAKAKMNVKCSNVILSGRLISYDFPDYKKILASQKHSCTFNKGTLLDNVVNMRFGLDDKTGRASFNISKGFLNISSENKAKVFNEGIRVMDYKDSLKFDCNGNFVFRAIDRIPGNKIKMMFSSGDAPIIFVPHEEERDLLDYDIVTLVVPMRRL